MQSVPGHARVQSDCWFPYAPMSRGVVRHQVSSRIRSVEFSPKKHHGITCVLFVWQCASLMEFNFYTTGTKTCVFDCLN